MQVQYIVTEQGKQVGVLLDMVAYQQLLAGSPPDPELLSGLSREELEALAASKLALETQLQLDDLLESQKQSVLSVDDEAQLEHLLAQYDQLTILKTRARLTLKETYRL